MRVSEGHAKSEIVEGRNTSVPQQQRFTWELGPASRTLYSGACCLSPESSCCSESRLRHGTLTRRDAVPVCHHGHEMALLLTLLLTPIRILLRQFSTSNNRRSSGCVHSGKGMKKELCKVGGGRRGTRQLHTVRLALGE